MTKTNSESALIVAKLAYDTVRLRIEAGDDPDDAMMGAWQIMESWVHVEVDGGWPKNRYAESTSKSASTEADERRSSIYAPCPERGFSGHSDTCTVFEQHRYT